MELRDFGRAYEDGDNHSWEDLQEDEYGNLQSVAVASEQAARRRRLLSSTTSARVRRGMIRYLQLVIDLSRAAGLSDMRPVRSAVMFGATRQFIRAFFDENPLSQLGIIVLRNGVAERLTELSSSPETHIDKLKQSLDTEGAASIQNGLDLAVASLSRIPPYGYRETLILLVALSTCDPGNILDSIKAAKTAKVRISVVGLAAEVHVCRVAATETGGSYDIATSDAHLEEIMVGHATPPPAVPGSSGVSLVRMGFPAKSSSAPGAAAFVGAECVLQPGAYVCPRCKARIEQLPAECHVCGLTLVSSPHLARSYHHLFPVKPFEEVSSEVLESEGITQGCGGGGGGGGGSINNTSAVDLPLPSLKGKRYCYGCSCLLEAPPQRNASSSSRGGRRGRTLAAAAVPAAVVVLRCLECRRLFCLDCDAFVHEHLHSCPGCECLPVKDSMT